VGWQVIDLYMEEKTMLRSMLQGMIWILIGTHFMLQGCAGLFAAGAGAAAGAGTAAYVSGSMETTYAASFDRTWDAALGAVEDANLRLTETDKATTTKGTIKAEQGDGTPVTLALEQAGPNTTEVKVRVGTFGDEEASKVIHRHIASRLGITTG
jgi:hypothetical protein